MSRRSVQKKAWLASDRKLRAAFAAAVFEGKPAQVWQAVCEHVSGAYKFRARPAQAQQAKPRKKQAAP